MYYELHFRPADSPDRYVTIKYQHSHPFKKKIYLDTKFEAACYQCP